MAIPEKEDYLKFNAAGITECPIVIALKQNNMEKRMEAGISVLLAIHLQQ